LKAGIRNSELGVRERQKKQGLGVRDWGIGKSKNKSEKSMHPSIENNLPQIRELCEKHKVRRLYLVGSALRDDFKPGESDFDFIVEYPDMEPIAYKNSYFGLIRELRALLQNKIDLTIMRAITNPYFLKEVLNTRRELYHD